MQNTVKIKENIKNNGKKVLKGAIIGAAGIAIGVIGIKMKNRKDMETMTEMRDEALEQIEVVMDNIESMSDKEYMRHLHKIEVIPDDVMHYIEDIEQENEILKQEVEELSIDKQELEKIVDFLERDIEDLEAQILGHEK